MEKLKKFAYKEKLTSTKLNKMVDAVNAKPDVVFLNEYEAGGKVLPTLKATFLYFDEDMGDGETYMTHGRTIYDIDNEIAGTPKYYHVFCCAHDKEQSGDGNGYIYIVYDDTLNYVRTYRIEQGVGEIPMVILRAFGEDNAFSDLSNLSAEGEEKIKEIAGDSLTPEQKADIAKIPTIEANQITANEIKEAMQSLPDGQAVSAQVAVNTEKLSELGQKAVMSGDAEDDSSDLDISDEEGNVLARFYEGHFKSKNFDSRNTATKAELEEVKKIASVGEHPVVTIDYLESDLDISDKNGNVVLRLKDGHIKTKNFDSKNKLDKKELGDAIRQIVGDVALPRPVIFDTDWWSDVDDACAVRILLWAERKGLIDLVGVCIDAIESNSVTSLDAFMNYEGRGGMCIGIDKQATDYGSGTHAYKTTILSNWNRHDYNSNDECEDCVEFYRRALSQAKQKVDIISVGYPNALSRLLDSEADSYSPLNGAELVRQKVNHLWMMAGQYPNGRENNFTRTEKSRVAGANICAKWTTEITFLGAEIGNSVKCGGTIKDTIGTDDLLYKILLAKGETYAENGREAWDPMTTLLACYGDDFSGYDFVYGTNVVDASTGENTFTANLNGRHRYVKKKYPNDWYRYHINNILERKDESYRVLGVQQLNKLN